MLSNSHSAGLQDQRTPFDLAKEATELLHKHEYRSDGRPLNAVSPEQRRFERNSLIPMGIRLDLQHG